jgi:hypothetical protein
MCMFEIRAKRITLELLAAEFDYRHLMAFLRTFFTWSGIETRRMASTMTREGRTRVISRDRQATQVLGQ